MNRQAFADIDAIKVRVEERRVGDRRPGSWRVHEFSGFDAIPARVRAAFAGHAAGEGHAVALHDRVWEAYQRRRVQDRFEEPYEVPCEDEPGNTTTVSRTVTISIRYKQQRVPVARAA